MDRVRDLVAAGGVSMVLAQDRDRFAREPAYHYLLRREFEEYGCKIRALNDRGDDTPEGELTDGILDQLAKFERAKTAERTRRGKLRKAREGKVLAGPRPPYGFRYNDARDNYVVDEETMRVIKRIFRMVGGEGHTMHAVRLAFNQEVATDQRAPAAIAPIAVGFALAVGVFIAGPVTGGSVNPARSLGPMLVAGDFTSVWLYILGPIIGGVLAALLYDRFLAQTEGPG